MRSLRELLVKVAPSPPDEPDLLGRVATRVLRRRRASRAALVGVVALLAAGMIVLPQWLADGPGRIPPAGPVPSAGRADSGLCPPWEDISPSTGQGAEEPVITGSPTEVALCTYESMTAVAQIDIADADKVVSAVNDLPDHAEFVDEHPEATEAGCFLMQRPQYRLVFSFSDKADTVVAMDMNCGTLVRGPVIRYGDITDVLDTFAEQYRDEGGDYPASPWAW